MPRTLRLTILLAAGLLTPVHAASWDYTISVPDGLEATFDLPFPVEHEGTVTIEATWKGPRLLFFGVEGPGHASLARRSGPSPQRLDLAAGPDLASRGASWKLTIKALPARGEASGHLRVTVPDAPDVVAKREAALHPPPPPPPPPPAWRLPRALPGGANAGLARVFENVEAFRTSVLPVVDASGDGCGWQLDFLQFAVAARDRLADRGAPPDVPSLRYFARLVEAIRNVDMLRTSRDAAIAGPVPADRDARHDWLLSRNDVVRPIERSLDELTELLRGGHAPSLEDEAWLPRFNACLTSCERFYDERVRLGGEDIAPNRELAGLQWKAILAAGRVLDAFGPYFKEPLPPDR